jgi:uncharacterized protein (TIGR02599 family)
MGDRRTAFTLVEVMVSMAILLSMMLIITEVIGQAQRSWKAASSRISQFRQARQAFDIITHGLRQAEINRYYAFIYPSAKRVPKALPATPPDGSGYVPANLYESPEAMGAYADLEIVTGNASEFFSAFGAVSDLSGDAVLFQGPFGLTQNSEYRPLNNALCARGYFTMFGDNARSLPSGLVNRLTPKYRYRTYELRQGTEYNGIFSGDLTSYRLPVSRWRTFSPDETVQPIAENIIGLLFAPLFGVPLSPDGSPASGTARLTEDLKAGQAVYDFDSHSPVGDPSRTGYLPRAIRVVAFAIDEQSAEKLATQYGTTSPTLLASATSTFTTVGSLKDDLAKLQLKMDKEKINFRIFSATVPILGGEW